VTQQCKGLASPDDLKFLTSASPARWLTCANRILRLYIATDKPSAELKKPVSFIVKVYATGWFHIRSHPHCFNGAINFFNIIDKNRSLVDSVMREAVQRTLARNSYFAHAENIFLAALADEDIAVRRDAARKISTARAERQFEVRKFSKANVIIDFGCTSYYTMIN
jgi:hypothetical protein